MHCNMKGRRLPRTTTILHHENDALKNKVSCLDESLHAAYTEIQALTEIVNADPDLKAKLYTDLLFEKSKVENEKLKEKNKILQQELKELKEFCAENYGHIK